MKQLTYILRQPTSDLVFTTRPIIMKTKYIGVVIDLFGGHVLINWLCPFLMLHEGSAGGNRVKDAKMFVKSPPGGQD